MKHKKLFNFLLAIIMIGSVSLSTACGKPVEGGTPGNKLDDGINLDGKDADNDQYTIECYLYSAGYGVDWFNACASEFMKRYPEYKIVAQESSSNTTLRKKLSLGSDFTADLLIVGDNINGILAEGSSVYKGYPVIFENLDDVYNSVPLTDSGNVTMAQKMDSAVAQGNYQTVTINGSTESHYYAAPWTDGYNGLCYNVELFKAAGLTSEPRTTNELLSYCDTLKAHDIVPIIMSSADDYIEHLSWVWWAQYEGQEGIENFFYCRESSDAYPSADGRIFDQTGYVEMFRVIEALLGNNNVNAFCESFGYTDAQRYFLKGDKTKDEHGAIMPNGNWLENEMIGTSTSETIANVSMMKTPIVSALVDKLSVWKESTTYNAANLSADKKAQYDAILCSLVDYVDGVSATKPEGVTDDDVAIVRKARGYYSGGGSATLAIPVYATAKEGAKKFISFMASDIAIDLYYRNTNGCFLPYDFDYKNNSYYAQTSDFSKKVISLIENGTPVITDDSYITHYKGGFMFNQGINGYNFAITFGSRDAQSRLTTDQVIQNIKSYYKPTTLTAMLQNCGLML